MQSVKRGLGWVMMVVAGLVLFAIVLVVLEQIGWGPPSQEPEPLVILTVVAIFGTGAALGALGAYLAFSWRRAG